MKKKQTIFSLIHKNNIVLVERWRKLSIGKLSIKQLAAVKNMTEEELLKLENWDINNFFSPLCKTLLITIEEILNNIEELDISKSKIFSITF